MAPNFRRNVKKELNVCLRCFYTSARKKDGTYYKSSSMKSIGAAIDRFLCSRLHNKPFSIISDPAFTDANKVLDAFVQDLRKTGKTAGVVHKKAISKEQVKNLFEAANSEWQTACILHSYRGLVGSTSASFSEDGDVKTSDS